MFLDVVGASNDNPFEYAGAEESKLRDYLRVVEATSRYLRLPSATRCYLRLPELSQAVLMLPEAT